MRKIEKVLQEKKMSTYRLAQLIGASPQTTRNIVQKKQFGKEYVLLNKICKALDCEPKDLLNKEELTQLKNL
jgi:DNA-binding Xre family transcriptional regulator